MPVNALQQQAMVLADDLTGACEVAALARAGGLAVTVHLGPPWNKGPCALRVIDTNTRLQDDKDAALTVRGILAALDSGTAAARFFKKTDSVLRGPVAAELQAVAARLGCSRVLLVPANPASGRSVAGGIYRINGVPLDQTDFARDPHHPAWTADVVERIAIPGGAAVISVRPGQPLPARGILVADAADAADLEYWAAQLDDSTLAAGSAAFFSAVLRRVWLPDPASTVTPPCPPPLDRPTLIVSGTTAAVQKAFLEQRQLTGIATADLAAPALDATVARLEARLLHTGFASAFLNSSQAVELGRAADITAGLAAIAARAAGSVRGLHLVVEGGATAAAIAHRMNWAALAVVHEWAHGVVALQPVDDPSILLTLKPGSYPWPSCLHGIFHPRSPQPH